MPVIGGRDACRSGPNGGMLDGVTLALAGALAVAHRGTVIRVSLTRHSPAAHLSADQVADIERELDELRQRVMDSRGASDAAYIRRVITCSAAWSWAVARLLVGKRRPAWLLGTAGLSLAKILDNMEIGHNVLHGQWDWMRDPKIHSSTWEWDHITPARQWQRTHNQTHHKFTNIVGQDNDLGWGIMRVDEASRGNPGTSPSPGGTS